MIGDVARFEQMVGAYMLFGQIGAGGMATVHIGRRIGAAGFARLVAIKRLHPHLGKDRELVDAFLDEARIAARVNHPNVVSIDDVVMDGDEVLLVMEYVPGRSLSALAGAERAKGRPLPPPVAAAIAVDMLEGIEAAHTARDERGRELGLIHRDVSPQNVMVGVDGVSRVLDFGIAKAFGRMQTTETGAVKGKLAYMAPERLRDGEPTRSVDIYGAAIVIWELLAGQRYFEGSSDAAMIPKVLFPTYRPLGSEGLGAVDAVLARALAADPRQRHASARELAVAVARAVPVAARTEVAAWVQEVAGAQLAADAETVEQIEQRSVRSPRFLGTPLDGPPATLRETPGARETDMAVLQTNDPVTLPLAAPLAAAKAPPSEGQTTAHKPLLLVLTAGALLVAVAVAGIAARSWRAAQRPSAIASAWLAPTTSLAPTALQPLVPDDTSNQEPAIPIAPLAPVIPPAPTRSLPSAKRGRISPSATPPSTRSNNVPVPALTGEQRTVDPEAPADRK